MDIYQKDQLDLVEATMADDGVIRISVMPLMESAHYLAGAMLDSDDGRQRVQLVRCGVSEECAVDVKAEVTQGTPDPYTLTLPDASQPVDLVYADGTSTTIFSPN
ncbi:hypothetical protein [Actibacterium sp. 188UL27-1]|uniref:hypothetical protein n=1 Tax=Actibacterium sp. 188UL27-1 TaxID=2786961 RepID=UPI001959862F|nr:hypothetical protein [Actibacterium sp. 188UL27-1]MBM7068441.1 hypothetical protein [Actibacterium sp. 188UL27-1]